MTDTVTIGTSTASVVKSGVKVFTQSGTNTEVAGRFTTTILGTGVSNKITPAPGYFPGSGGDKVTTTISRNFYPVTGLLWTILQP